MRSLNIAMILDNQFPPDPRVQREATALIDFGHNVKLFALRFDKSAPTKEEIENIHVSRKYLHPFLYRKLSPLAYSNPLYHSLLKFSIKDFIENNRFDVIHIHDMQIAELVFRLNTKYELPIILDLHENRPEIMKSYSHVNSGLGKLLISVSKWAHKQVEFVDKADKVIVVTKEAKTDLAENSNIDPKKIHIVSNTIDYKQFRNYKIDASIISKYKNTFTLLYIGSTGLRRGLETVIKSLALLVDKIVEIKLVIVGQSRDDIILKELVNELRLDDYVDFEGWKNHELLPSYIEASDIGLSPLIKNKHHDTTLANKIFQYLALGKAIVVSDCLSQANLVKEIDCGLIHENNNPQDLAAKIHYLYKNKTQLERFGKNGLVAVQDKYNWYESSKSLLKLYNQIESGLDIESR